jgi:phenylacetate-coenzyme A ligase PaaK-like adenylate-forming protein
MILSCPSIFQNLAYFKKKGYGRNIKPKILISHGSVLDKYIKIYVEDAFGCKVINAYGSAESSSEAVIAIECMEGILHIHHDYYHVEVIDKNMELVGNEEKGHIVITRLFGKATPIVRYTGMDDWITLCNDYNCSCGLRTPIIKNGVAGRISTSIITPDGTIYPEASFISIYDVLVKYNTQKVKQFQIIQKKINEIDINIVIDEDLKNIGPPVDLLFKEIKKIHQLKVGPNVKINVKEAKNILSEKNKPTSTIISNLTLETKQKVLDKIKF